jgi:hypothetical protein
MKRFSVLVIIIALHLLAGCSGEDDPVTPPADHFQPEGITILSGGDTLVVYFQGVVRPGDTLKAPAGNNLSPHWNLRFMDGSRQELAPPSVTTHQLGWTIANNAVAEVYRDPGDEWDFHLRGKESGVTTITFRVLHGGHADFTTVPIPVLVDSSIHGEAAGLLILDEESGDTLVAASSMGVTGALSVPAGVTSDHAVLYFVDGENVRFQPPVPPHSFGFTIADTTKATLVPAGASEPWAFQVEGRTAGSTTLVIRLLSGGVAEWVSPTIPVTITP